MLQYHVSLLYLFSAEGTTPIIIALFCYFVSICSWTIRDIEITSMDSY